MDNIFTALVRRRTTGVVMELFSGVSSALRHCYL